MISLQWDKRNSKHETFVVGLLGQIGIKLLLQIFVHLLSVYVICWYLAFLVL